MVCQSGLCQPACGRRTTHHCFEDPGRGCLTSSFLNGFRLDQNYSTECALVSGAHGCAPTALRSYPVGCERPRDSRKLNEVALVVWPCVPPAGPEILGWPAQQVWTRHES